MEKKMKSHLPSPALVITDSQPVQFHLCLHPPSPSSQISLIEVNPITFPVSLKIDSFLKHDRTIFVRPENITSNIMEGRTII